MDCVQFTVNGKKCSVDAQLPADTSLYSYLRYELQLRGTKSMCKQGGCGLCIVMVRACRPTTGSIETFSVNSCLVLVFSCHGWDITTVEGVGNRKDGYSEVQKKIAAFNGTQCGFCTPGWVMQLHSLLDKNLTSAQLEQSFGSNTCRCTGYRPILDTIKSFGSNPNTTQCHQSGDIEDASLCERDNQKCKGCRSDIDDHDDDWTVVSIDDATINVENFTIKLDFGDSKFYKAINETQIFDILNKEGYDSYMLVDGNTAKGIIGIDFRYPRVLIDISSVKSLKEYKFDQNLQLGGNITLQNALTLFKEIARNNDDFLYLEKFADHFAKIAHIPVRNIGSLAGNLILKYKYPSYQSDVFLLFESIGATITLKNSFGTLTTLKMTDFLMVKNLSGLLIVNIKLPPLSDSHAFRSFKIMPRHQNALAIVNAAFLVKINQNTNVIEEASLVYGNISSTFVHARNTETFVKGKNVFNNTTLQAALKVLSNEVIPADNPPDPSPECRKKLALGLFYRFILNISPKHAVNPRRVSGAEMIQRPLSRGVQQFQSNPSLYPLNQPVQKLEALIQSSGEAQYTNDVPNLPKQVFAAFVLSSIHNGQLDDIHTSEILKQEGIIAVYTAKDIPGKNSFITLIPYLFETVEEEIIASDEIKFYGQPIAIVVAVTESLAIQAARDVKVTYKNVRNQNAVLTIDKAKKDKSRLIASDQSIIPKGRGTNVRKIVKGVYTLEGQYHYYTEPVSCIVVPVDNGLDVYDSTQWISFSQMAIAAALMMKESDVRFKVRRVGGGFGGKVSTSVRVSTSCALVARKLDVPCRFVLPIETNMTVSGKRTPGQIEYEVGVDDDGFIQYLNAMVIHERGFTNNENFLPFVLIGVRHCYITDYWCVYSASVLTDKPSQTFMRAPGMFEGIAMIEHIMEHIAFEINKDPTEVRLRNMITEENDLPEMIATLKRDAEHDRRYQEIQEFNRANRWMKKAIQTSVLLYNIQYFKQFHAVVSIYEGDGSVSVTSGGIEIGQGINTKVAQVCAYSLGIPLDYVSVLPSYSFVASNDFTTAASITSESVCYAVIQACDIIKKRLDPIRQELGGNPSWKDLIKRAGDEYVDLTANFMMNKNDLTPYNTFSVGILETQLDVLTGRFEILRVDILEDVGLSVNQNIDIGQVEGAYVQALGFFTSEKLVYDQRSGRLLTNRSLNYHVPLALDIPADFRVKLRYNSRNTKGVLGSKAVGEMSSCIAVGISHALRRCITESRRESGYDPGYWITIDTPHDTEAILEALAVKPEELLLD